MNFAPHTGSLNQHQLEILKLFARELDDHDLIEIKKLIVRYLASKITAMADEVWDQNKWTDEDMERLLQTHKRMPYNPNN